MTSLIVQRRLRVLTPAGVALLAAFAGGCGVDAKRTPAVGFGATVYETQLPGGQAGRLDAAKLNAAAAQGEDLRKILAEVGPTKVIHRLCQPVGPNSDCRISLESRVPRIKSTRVAAAGRRINTVRYEKLGAIFTLYTQPAPNADGDKLHVRLNVELAVPGRSGLEIAPGVPAPITRNVTMSYNGPAETGRPFVAVVVNPATPPTAYVCRVVVAPTGPGPPASAPSPAAATTADFQARVYRLLLPAGRVDGIDVEALARAADARQLQTRLAQLGKTTVLQQAGQPVSLTSESVIRVTERKPVVMGTRVTESGRRINMVQHEQVGAIFRIAAEPITRPSPRKVRIRLSAEVADLVDGKAEVAGDVRPGVHRTAAITYNGAVDIGRPFVFLCADASSEEKDDDAVVYICSITLSNLR